MEILKHSVRLDPQRCHGCINCIKRCPTQAIRVRDGKARIIEPFCIDCGQCISACPYHAKRAEFDSLENIKKKYKYTVVVTTQSLYSQFNHLDDINVVLQALLNMGFDDVFEASEYAQANTKEIRQYMEAHPDIRPLISPTCPTIVRLISVRFPSLIPNIVPVRMPMEMAAQAAAKRAMEKTGLPREDIGICVIVPCPSKVTYIRYPSGVKKSEIDAALVTKDIYKDLLKAMENCKDNYSEIAHFSATGMLRGCIGGEASGVGAERFLMVDAIDNVTKVLEEMEDQKLNHLQYVELRACQGGCVGGVLNVENRFLAKARLEHFSRRLNDDERVVPDLEGIDVYWDTPLEYNPVFQLGKNRRESFTRLAAVGRQMAKFPGVDCGSCGAPTCRALAEDIVRGSATEDDCVYIVKDRIRELSHRMADIAEQMDLELESDANRIRTQQLQQHLEKMTKEIDMLNNKLVPPKH